MFWNREKARLNWQIPISFALIQQFVIAIAIEF